MATGFNDDWSAGAAEAIAGTVDGAAEFDLDAEGVDAENIGKGGLVDQEGKYHFEIQDAKRLTTAETYNKKRPEFELRCVVLKSVSGQSPQGSILFHRVEVPCAEDKLQNVKSGTLFKVILDLLCEFGIACGIFRKHEGKVIDPETNSTKLGLMTFADRLKGCQFIGAVEREDFEKKDGTKGHSFRIRRYGGVSSVDDPRNAEVQMNQAALQTIGKTQAKPPDGPSGPAGAAKPKHPAGNGSGGGAAKSVAAAGAAATQKQQAAFDPTDI